MGHPAHWSICLLHFNELPLKKLFHHFDGVTVGPKQFSGPIGKMLTGCKQRQIQDFNPVFSDDLPVWPDKAVKELSVDQRYLYEMCHAIQSGFVSQALEKKEPGALVHSRFLTTANRILRYYVSLSSPSRKLITMVDFIIKVYAPFWFAVKTAQSLRMGPLLIFKYIEMVRENVDAKLHDMIFTVVSNNGYFAHAENVLVTMLSDENYNIRKLAVDSILKTKSSSILKTI